MANCVKCVHHDVCVKLGKPALYGINKELGCDKYLEVVRCKDCKRCSHDSMFGGYWCNGHRVKADDFCSYGERRTTDVR